MIKRVTLDRWGTCTVKGLATAVLDKLLLYLIVRVILDNAVDRLHSDSSVGKDWLQQCWKRLLTSLLEELVTAVLEKTGYGSVGRDGYSSVGRDGYSSVGKDWLQQCCKSCYSSVERGGDNSVEMD